MSVVELEGGCRVAFLVHGERGVAVEHQELRIQPLFGRACGAHAISLRALEFGPGLSPGLSNDACDEVLYVLQGRATVFVDGHRWDISDETGLYLPPGRKLTVDNRGPAPLVVLSSRCPEPKSSGVRPTVGPLVPTSRPDPSLFVRLEDRPAVPTGDRWYRVLVDEAAGCGNVTQFIGSIPPGRAPDHYHQYEEVLFILKGEGRMWAGSSSAPIASGSCVFLPRGQVHCVENTGSGELRLLGVFYPAGSPAVRYGAD